MSGIPDKSVAPPGFTEFVKSHDIVYAVVGKPSDRTVRRFGDPSGLRSQWWIRNNMPDDQDIFWFSDRSKTRLFPMLIRDGDHVSGIAALPSDDTIVVLLFHVQPDPHATNVERVFAAADKAEVLDAELKAIWGGTSPDGQ